MTRIGPSHATKVRRPAAEDHARAAKHASGPRDVLEARQARPSTTWWLGRPLSEGRNAHKTNTKEQFDAALKDGKSNWFEGDVRKELHGDRIEMRHDAGPELGDNLTLKEWLAKGKASGRGLKLDVKDSDQLPGILQETKDAHIPSERLMFNLGAGELDKFGKQIRREFPNATIAINVGGGGKKMDDHEVKRMLGYAKAVGQPCCFVERYDRLTDKAIKRLEKTAPISVWNDEGSGHLTDANIARTAAALQKRGVTGIIDLRPTMSGLDKVESGIDVGRAAAGDWINQRANDVKRTAGDVVDKVGGFFGL